MSLEKQQQKKTKHKKTHLNLSYVDYGDVYGPYIKYFKFNLDTITYKSLIAIYKYKSVWILNNLKWTLSRKLIDNSI